MSDNSGIEIRLVSIDMIDLKLGSFNQYLVRTLVDEAEDDILDAIVFLRPRPSPLHRYPVYASPEVAIAARELGMTGVRAMIADWPQETVSLIPQEVLSALIKADRKQSNPGASKQSKQDAVLSQVPETPIALAKYYQSLIKRHGSQARAGKAIGKSRAHINNFAQLLKLTPLVADAVEQGRVPHSAGRIIAIADNPLHQIELYDWYISQQPRPTIRELEISLKTVTTDSGGPSSAKVDVDSYSRLMSEELGVDFRIRPTGGTSGWCSVGIYLDADTGKALPDRFDVFIAAAQSLARDFSVSRKGRRLSVRFSYADYSVLDSIVDKIS